METSIMYVIEDSIVPTNLLICVPTISRFMEYKKVHALLNADIRI